MRRLLTLLILLLALIVVAACDENGGDEDGNNSNGVEAPSRQRAIPTETPETAGEGATITPTSLDPASEDPPVLPALDGPTGRLFFVFSDTLYASGFDGQAATLIAEGVNPAKLFLSPDGGTLIYGTSGAAVEPAIYLLDVSSLDATQLEADVLGTERVTGWSPDREWFTLQHDSVAPIFVVSRDGRTVQQLGERVVDTPDEPQPPVNMSSGWLSDGQVFIDREDYERLVNSVDEENVAVGLSARTFAVYDPISQERTLIDDITDLNRFTITRGMEDYGQFKSSDEALAELGLGLAVPYPVNHDVIIQGEMDAILTPPDFEPLGYSPAECSSQTLVRQGVREAALPDPRYSAPQSSLLSDLHQTETGAVYFVRWYPRSCGNPDTLMRELLRLPAEGEAQVLTQPSDVLLLPDQIYMGGRYAVATGEPYALSPAGDYVAWLHQDMEAGESRLQIIALADGTAQAVLVAPAEIGEVFEVIEGLDDVPPQVLAQNPDLVQDEETGDYLRRSLVPRGLTAVLWVE